MPEETQRLAHSIGRAAEILNISRSFTYLEIKAGRLRSFKAGRRHLISDEAIRDYIRSREREAQNSAT